LPASVAAGAIAIRPPARAPRNAPSAVRAAARTVLASEANQGDDAAHHGDEHVAESEIADGVDNAGDDG
jgi:hypothetical protein